MKTAIKILLAMTLLILVAPCFGADSPANIEYPEDTAARLQEKLDNLTSLSFQFYQDTRGEMTGKPRRGSGRAQFYKDGDISYMRWDYFSPDRQVLVSDGELFRMYFAELHQMIVTPTENLKNDLTYSFFTGRGTLQKDFYIRPPDEDYQSEDEAAFKVIKLIPKVPQSQLQDVHIWVTTSSLIRRFTIRDLFGTITVLNLSDIEINTLAATPPSELSEIFSFTPPDDTEIIYQ